MVESEMNEGVQKIRYIIQKERALIAALEHIPNEQLTRRLKHASDMLDDVESVFLDPKRLQEPGIATGLAGWLDKAAKELQLAAQQRIFAEAILNPQPMTQAAPAIPETPTTPEAPVTPAAPVIPASNTGYTSSAQRKAEGLRTRWRFRTR